MYLALSKESKDLHLLCLSSSAPHHKSPSTKLFNLTGIQFLHISQNNIVFFDSCREFLWGIIPQLSHLCGNFLEKYEVLSNVMYYNDWGAFQTCSHILNLWFMVVARFSFLKHSNNFTRFIAVLFPKCFALLYVLIILRLLPTHQWFVVHMEIEVVKIYNNAIEIYR